jgi:hypothetical protein
LQGGVYLGGLQLNDEVDGLQRRDQACSRTTQCSKGRSPAVPQQHPSATHHRSPQHSWTGCQYLLGKGTVWTRFVPQGCWQQHRSGVPLPLLRRRRVAHVSWDAADQRSERSPAQEKPAVFPTLRMAGDRCGTALKWAWMAVSQ